MNQATRPSGIWQSLVVYAAVGWATLEMLLAVRERMALPEWIEPILFAVFLAGFVMTALLSWYASRAGGSPLKRTIHVLLITMMSSGVALGIGRWLGEADAPIGEVSIAVLPCSFAGDPDYGYLGRSLAQEVHTQLASREELRVPSWRAVTKTHAVDPSPGFAAEHLKTQLLAVCDVQKEAEQLVINARVMNPSLDRVLFKRRYEFSTAEMASMLSRLTQAIVKQIAPSSTRQNSRRTLTAVDPAAFELYLKARATKDISIAMAIYERAIVRDPEFADAYSGLAQRQAEFRAQAPSESEEGWILYEAAARRNALKALELDDCNADAWLLGTTLQYGDWDDEFKTEDAGALADKSNYELIQRAIDCQPNHAQAWLELAMQYHGQRYDGPEISGEAMWTKQAEAMQRAVQLDPVNCMIVVNTSRLPGPGKVYLRSPPERAAYSLDPAGQKARAHEVMKAGIQKSLDTIRSMLLIDPDCGEAYVALANYRKTEGLLDQALAWRIKHLKLGPDNPDRMLDVADEYMELDMPEQADTWSRHAQSIRYYTSSLPWSRLRQGDASAMIEFAERFTAEVADLPNPDPVRTAFSLAAQGMLLARDFERAGQYLEHGMARLDSDDPIVLLPAKLNSNFRKLVAQDYARIYQELGQTERADRLLEQGRRPDPEDWDRSIGNRGEMFVYANARYEALKGNPARAMRYIRRAVDELQGYSGRLFPGMFDLIMDPCIDSVREDPVTGPQLQQLIEEFDARLAPMRERVLTAEASGDWESLRVF